MGSLSDYIESYLKLLLDNGPHDLRGGSKA